MLTVAGLFAALHSPSVASADESPRATSQDCESIGDVGLTAIDLIGQPDISNGTDVAEETEDRMETVDTQIRCRRIVIGYTDEVRKYCVRWETREDPDGAGSSRVCVEWDLRIVTIPVIGTECEYVEHTHGGGVTASVVPSGPTREYGETEEIRTLPSVGSDVALVSESLEL